MNDHSALALNKFVSGNETHIVLSGRLDHTTVAKLRKAVRDSLNEPAAAVVINFAKVNWLDSMSMGVLMSCHQLLEARNRKLVLTECNGMLLKALQLVNFHRILEIR